MKKIKNTNLILGALAISTVNGGIVTNATEKYTLFENKINTKETSKDKYSIDWNNSIGGDKEDVFYDIIQSKKDGHYIAVGQSSVSPAAGFSDGDAIITKYDASGNGELWTNQDHIVGDETDRFYSVVELKDNSLLAIGVSYSTDIPGIQNTGREGKAIIAKYTPDGKRSWVKPIPIGNTNDAFALKTGVALSDGGALLVCSKVNNRIGGATIDKNDFPTYSFVKVSSTGVIEQKSYNNTSKELVINDMIKTSDDKILLTGYTFNKNTTNESELVIAKLNEDLTEVWATVTNEDFIFNKGISLTEGKDKEIYVVGEVKTDKTKDSNALLTRVNKDNGEIEWMATVNGDKYDSFNGVVVNKKGDVIVVGHSNSENKVNNKNEIVMAKYGVDGNQSDYITLGKDTEDLVVNSVLIDKNDKIIIAGKKGFGKGVDPCDVTNPCIQYDAMLLSVTEDLDDPIYCDSTTPTLVVKDATIKKNQKINPLDYVSIKEENLKHLEKNITFETTLSGSGTEYYADKAGKHTIKYTLTNGCNEETTSVAIILVEDDSCDINPPVINAEDKYTYYIGDKFDILSIIKVNNINNSKVIDSKTETINGKTVTTVVYESGDKIVATTDIDYNKEGTYNINYAVSNKCGESTKDVSVTVKQKDANNNSTGNNSTTDKPQTGDNIFVYAVASIAAVSGLFVVNKKSNRKNELDDNNEENN